MAGIGKTIAEIFMAALAVGGIVQAFGRGWEGWRGSDNNWDSDGGDGHHGG